jgi:hypothetical protein
MKRHVHTSVLAQFRRKTSPTASGYADLIIAKSMSRKATVGQIGITSRSA